jgi:hypothetical protein
MCCSPPGSAALISLSAERQRTAVSAESNVVDIEVAGDPGKARHEDVVRAIRRLGAFRPLRRYQTILGALAVINLGCKIDEMIVA